MVPALLTADIHLTDNPRDDYRWGLFDWLRRKVFKYQVRTVLILGDLTDAKDRHSSVLVNRLVDELLNLSQSANVMILKGNHDFVDENWPFFQFTSSIDRVSFISEPYGDGIHLFLPSTKNWREDWRSLDLVKPRFIFTHATFDGCLTENGTKLNGIPPSIFKGFKGRVYSGDIHVPQVIGKNIEYVGAPYRVRFGDEFEPRVLLLREDGTTKDLHFPCKSKHVVTIRSLDDLPKQLKKQNVVEGDQVKLRVRLKRSEYSEWPGIKGRLREVMEERRLELYGPQLLRLPEKEPKEKKSASSGATWRVRLAEYVERKRFGKDMQILGESFVKEAMK